MVVSHFQLGKGGIEGWEEDSSLLNNGRISLALNTKSDITGKLCLTGKL